MPKLVVAALRLGTVMKIVTLRRAALLVVATLAAFTTAPARAGEGYFWTGSGPFSASFNLIGGQYLFYVDAHLPPAWVISGLHSSCTFSGNFARLWPTHDTMQLGGPVRIYLIPYRVDQASLTLPAGVYRFYVAPMTDCQWTLAVGSNNQNAAGIAPVEMLRGAGAGMTPATTASVSDLVQFYAQFRTDHEARVEVSGTIEIIHAGKVWATLPLKVGQDPASKANRLYVDVQFRPSATQHLGTNTVVFKVKIGSAELASSGQFTLTP
jgi:hypothetical protein